MKKALITGITGQDGAYLAELLIKKGYQVHGIKRRSSCFNTQRIDHLYQELHHDQQQLLLHYGDVTDTASIISIIQRVQPDEIYNLAAQSHVKVSFETPEYTAQADALGTLRILEAIRLLGLNQKTKFYQASTSELFGNSPAPQNESTPFAPCSPYATAKLYAHWITKNYREAYDIFACSGILFNHESPLRGETFVSRKITRAAARIAYGLQDQLYLGNLDAQRDWGYARDYVEAMWLMLQQPQPIDLVIATGKSYRVRDFVNHAFALCGLPIIWQGTGAAEQGINAKNGNVIIKIDQRYLRPNELHILQGDASKAALLLGWKPTADFQTIVGLMVEHDLTLVEQEISKTPALSTLKNKLTTPTQLKTTYQEEFDYGI